MRVVFPQIVRSVLWKGVYVCFNAVYSFWLSLIPRLMSSSLITEKCEEENTQAASECIYRKIFNENFSLSFGRYD